MSVWDDQQARISWFSGMLEADGCANLAKGKSCRIIVANTDKDIIAACESFLAEYAIHSTTNVHSQSVKRPRNKRCFEITVRSANECYTLIKRLGDAFQCRRHEFMEKLELRASETTRDAPLRADVSWFVGFFEGKGSFSIVETHRRHRMTVYQTVIDITNTSTLLLEKVALTLKSLGLSWYVSQSWGTGSTQPCHHIRISGFKRCQRFLNKLRGVWRSSTYNKRAEIMLEFCNTRLAMPKSEPYTEKQRQIYLQMRMKG